MKLFLCEKPSQGNDIAKVLGAKVRSDGCLYTPDKKTCVTWAIGHLVEQFAPADYNEQWQKWSLDTLPIIPKQWELMVKKETKKQFDIVMNLLKYAKIVIIATDIDREGETIARELLELAHFKGNIQRLWLSALDDVSIRKALTALKSNQETLPLYHAGLARSRADWLIGMNFSRLITLLAQQKGYQGVPLSVGRVQSPTLALVVNRDRDIVNFVPKAHFTLQVNLMSASQHVFTAQYVIPEQYLDEDGLCLNKQVIQQAQQRISQSGSARVISIEKKREKENPPLLFALSDLQKECDRIFGMGAQQVLDIAQSLYETHKATTYPRTDCGYLPESQLTEAPTVIHALTQSDPKLQNIVPHLNLQQKSRAWNDKKITAHHGIIPTTGLVNLSAMNDHELKVYDLIRRRYLAQFLPLCETDKTILHLDSHQCQLISKGKVTINPGWRVLFGKMLDDNEDHDVSPPLPPLQQNEICQVTDQQIKSLQTSPPSHYTEGTLLSAMINAARFVTDERLKQRLKETEGLGTEATRAALIQGLLDKGFLKKKGKSVIATEQACTLIDSLPPVLKDPGLTALWEQALNQIAEKTLTLAEFMQKQEQFVKYLMQECLKHGVKITQGAVKPCPKCSAPMVKRTGKNGDFWGCSRYPNCDGIENIGGRKTKRFSTSVRKKASFTGKILS